MNLFLIYYGLTTLLICNIIKGKESNPYLEALSQKQWKSVHKYVEVRPGAFLFYWFYFADGTVYEAEKKPLIIWIQGGPGLAATGIANFAEIGPLTMDMKPRNHTWVKRHNLLLIDHPVGTGFSFAVNKSLHVKTDKDAAKDLLRIIKAFFKTNKEFRKTPTYLFGQSYGGKLCPRLGYYLQAAIRNKRLKMNFKGIGIGSGWVDPKRSTLVQPGFLYDMGVIDLPTYTKTIRIAKKTGYLIEKREYVSASVLQDTMFNILNIESGMKINFNNINQVSPDQALQELTYKVNKYVKPTLTEVNQSLNWNYVSDVIFNNLNNSFLIPSTKFLESLLNHTQLKVAIYNGNLDVVTPLAGATNWVHALKWHGAHDFMNAKRIRIRGNTNGFFKTAKQLSFWSVFGSGHWVPEDNPEAMEQILAYMTSDTQNEDFFN